MNTRFLSNVNVAAQPLAVSGSNLFVLSPGATYNTGTLSVYDAASEAPVNAPLLTGLVDPGSVAVSDSNIFIMGGSDGEIDKYTLSGTLVSPSIVSGIVLAYGMVVVGSDLFVLNNQRISEYTTSGVPVNLNLVTGLPDTVGITASGTDLFVTKFNSTGSIAEYSTSGALVEPGAGHGVKRAVGYNGIWIELVCLEPGRWTD